MERITAAVECRASESGPVLRGVIVSEGRAATGGRRELFAPGAIVWPSDGIAIRRVHLGTPLARAIPTREADGRITVETRATDDIRRAVDRDGARFMSVEFTALEERTTAGGVREVLRAMVDGACLTTVPEYDTTGAAVEAREAAQGAAEALSWL